MRNTLVALVIFLSTVSTATADDLRDRVAVMLSAYESQPSADEWQQLGSACVPVLTGIANDSHQPTFRRARALLALGYFTDASAGATLEATADCVDCDQSLRRHALLGLRFGQNPQVVKHAALALESRDPATRQVAIKVLTGLTPDANEVLREHRAREDRAALVNQIDAALAAGQ